MNQIRPRKIPVLNLDRAAYLERHKKATAAWGGKTFEHFATEAEWEAYKQAVKEQQDSGLIPF